MIIVGLGNPGKEYASTRHNMGFMFIDEVAKANNVIFKLDKALEALIGILYVNNNKHILVKPITYMNKSGDAVYKVLNYYSLNTSDLLVVYDDMDIPLGSIKIRKQGSSGGHNGIKSIINSINTTVFNRIRIGIGRNTQDSIDFVLGKLGKNEMKEVQDIFNKAPNIIDDYINKGVDYIMNNYNS